MASRRVERVEQAIRQAVSEIVLKDLKDPRVGFITITRVKASPDLRQAKVFFSALGAEAEQSRAAHCLRHARGFIQREVGRCLAIRYTPELTFAEDEGLKASAQVSQLLNRIRQERIEHGHVAGGSDDPVEPGPEAT